MTGARFRLYIVGTSVTSLAALRSVRSLCEELGAGSDLEVIDVLEHPEQADADRIVATPTLIRLAPLPARRVIGNLSDRTAVLDSLGLEFPSSGPSAAAEPHGRFPP